MRVSIKSSLLMQTAPWMTYTGPVGRCHWVAPAAVYNATSADVGLVAVLMMRVLMSMPDRATCCGPTTDA